MGSNFNHRQKYKKQLKLKLKVIKGQKSRNRVKKGHNFYRSNKVSIRLAFIIEKYFRTKRSGTVNVQVVL